MPILEELKQEYNHNLRRYYNGIKYCEEHIDEVDLWILELNKISYVLGNLIDEISQYRLMSNKEILGGFEE